MPLYEFGCQDCDAQFEKFVRSFNAINTVSCPDCGSAHIQKQMSTFASHIQGSSSSAAAASAASCAPGGL